MKSALGHIFGCYRRGEALNCQDVASLLLRREGRARWPRAGEQRVVPYGPAAEGRAILLRPEAAGRDCCECGEEAAEMDGERVALEGNANANTQAAPHRQRALHNYICRRRRSGNLKRITRICRWCKSRRAARPSNGRMSMPSREIFSCLLFFSFFLSLSFLFFASSAVARAASAAKLQLATGNSAPQKRAHNATRTTASPQQPTPMGTTIARGAALGWRPIDSLFELRAIDPQRSSRCETSGAPRPHRNRTHAFRSALRLAGRLAGRLAPYRVHGSSSCHLKAQHRRARC